MITLVRHTLDIDVHLSYLKQLELVRAALGAERLVVHTQHVRHRRRDDEVGKVDEEQFPPRGFVWERIRVQNLRQDWYERRRRVRPVDDAGYPDPVFPFIKCFEPDEEERELEKELEEDERFEPRRGIRHEGVGVCVDVKLQQRFHEARDDRRREERLGVHHERRGDVRPEEHEHDRAEGLADGHAGLSIDIQRASNCGRRSAGIDEGGDSASIICDFRRPLVAKSRPRGLTRAYRHAPSIGADGGASADTRR